MPRPPKRAQRPTQNLAKSDHTFRLGARPKYPDSIRWAGSFAKLVRAVKRAGKTKRSSGPTQYQDKAYHQRTSVRAVYSQRPRSGQWRAHGVYIERESARPDQAAVLPGVSSISDTLNAWQEAGDDLLWKIIVSPENGHLLDMEQHVRDLMAAIESDLGYQLDWRHAIHNNTDHPHVHIVIRGVDATGRKVHIPPNYIKEGMRNRSAELATAKLGYRLDTDILESQERMVMQPRYTDLDRKMSKQLREQVFVGTDRELHGLAADTQDQIRRRLEHLVSIGLAHRNEAGSWEVAPDLEQSLRTFQQTSDRQRMIQRFGVMASDPAIPFQRSRWRDFTSIEGRVLLHGEEDNRKSAFVLIEDVNGVIRQLDHRPEVEAARQKGMLQPGAYVSLRAAFVERKPYWIVEDHGPAEAALANAEFLEKCARRGVNPNHIYKGWLGQFREEIKRVRLVPNVDRPDVLARKSSENFLQKTPSFPVEKQGVATSKPKQTKPVISAADAREEFRQALIGSGLIVKGEPIADGKIHKVAVEGSSKGRKSGAYTFHLDGIPAGFIENFKTGERTTWKASGSTQAMTPAQIQAARDKAAKERAHWQSEKEKTERMVATRSERRWRESKPVINSGYLQRKGVESVGQYHVRMSYDGKLLVPMRDVSGKMWGVQTIAEDGTKLYPKGVRKQGTFCLLGDIDPTHTIMIAEGFATAASVRAATWLPTVATFDSSNLLPVAQAIRKQYPKAKMIFAADNDHHLPKKKNKVGAPLPNVGIVKAEEAAKAVKGIVIAPQFADDDKRTDWNDYVLEHGVEGAKLEMRRQVVAAKQSMKPTQ
jgi:phage/plasmid primase-like uncharacterized protein/type IV secretory pathway VirD2 relaxase